MRWCEQLAKLLGEKGISNDQTIVLYSGNNNWFAAYAYWLFKYRGVDNVKLLNGGRKKWELESRLLNQDDPGRSSTTFQIGPENPDIRIFREEVLERAKSGNAAWVDVRSPEEFRGELLARDEAEGVTDSKQVIAYCRIGERSSHTWFALTELLGFKDVKNYDGSWTEYGSLVGVPVEK